MDLKRLLVLFCMLLLLFSASAFAESGDETLKVTIAVSPDTLVIPDEVTVTITMENISDTEIQNVTVESPDGTVSEPIGHLHPEETQTLVRTIGVTEADLDKGELTYIIAFDDPTAASEKRKLKLKAGIRRTEANPSVDFTRQFSSPKIAKGGLLTLTYKVRNNGNVPLSDIELRDEATGFVARVDNIDVYEAETFISRVTAAEDVESEPTLSYKTPDGRTRTVELSRTTVPIAENALDLDFTMQCDDETAVCTLTLTNSGKTDLYGLSVTDDVYGGLIANAIALPQGASREVSHTCVIREEMEGIRWRVKASGDNGEDVECATETIDLPQADMDAETHVALTVDAVPRVSKISHAGNVTFDLTLNNIGSELAENVLLYEVERGEIRKLAALPTDSTTNLSVTYRVEAEDQFIFCLNYTDENGHSRTVTTAPITVEIGVGGETPETEAQTATAMYATPAEIYTSSSVTMRLGIVSATALVLGVILLTARRSERRAPKVKPKKKHEGS